MQGGASDKVLGAQEAGFNMGCVFNDLQCNKRLSDNVVKIPLSFLQYVLGAFYTLLRNVFKRFSSILYTFPAD